jgi:predicted MPP superfamily phosphohydrolase
LLAHQPASAVEAAIAGFHLQLSGHTHGGQFFPGTLFARIVFPFVAGLAKRGAMWIYTSRGAGFTGAQLRTVPSEITRLRLVRA